MDESGHGFPADDTRPDPPSQMTETTPPAARTPPAEGSPAPETSSGRDAITSARHPDPNSATATTAELADLRRRLGMPEVVEARRAERERRRGHDAASPTAPATPAIPAEKPHQPGHGYGHGRQFGYGHGKGHENRRRVESYDPEKTQILGGLHGRRVPRAESFRMRHEPSAEGLIPMSGMLTGEFFLGGRTRPEPAASPTVRPRAESVDYGLDDLSQEIGTEGRHRAESVSRGTSRSRAIWTLVDQVLSSGTNAVMSFVIARSVSPSEFGAFGVAFAIFSLMIGFSKAAGTSPLGMRFADVSPSVFRAAGAAGTGTSFVIGLASGAVTLVFGLAIGGAVGSSLVAMGLVFPALLVQDAWRQVFFAEGRPAAAALNDGVWAIVQFGAIFALVVRNVSTSWAMLAAWGGAAAVAAVLGLRQAGFTPATNQVRAWLVEHRDINGYMCAEYLTVQGAQQASTLLIGTLGAIDLVGALRGVQTLLGPTTILAVGIVSWAIPEFSRRKDMSARARLRAAYALSGVIVAVGVAWGTIFLLLPASVGHALLGGTWGETHHLLALSIIQQAGPAATVGPACMLYALGRAKLTFRANAILAPQLLVYPVIGLHIGGSTGAVVGYIAAFWITVPFWFMLVAGAAREAASETTDATPQPDTSS
ncbi:Membrane protein involved in the export of O-antigen and teichoic acid [Frankia sp. AiPs1]|uniref:hypothetical protein n=1 Tax=Frankia sp. AiPa1 TaxID=573492 RepID=UPI00202B6EE8|nr:hypothetical protein [Frankia sp. AiPa1]MCL9762234.1 hypothetical protein [Frankia sp. AiPa1]